MKLFANYMGVAGLPAAKIASGGIGYNGKIIISTSLGKLWRYQDDQWTQIADAGDLVNGAQSFTAITRDDIDVLFVSFGTTGSTPGTSGIYRSINDGTTLTRVCPPVGDTEWGSDTSCKAIVEDDSGNLWAGAYPKTGDHPSLYKSSDGGITWALVKTFTGEKHIHSVYWCPSRKVLLVATGDAGSGSHVKYTYDYGVTWNTWMQTVQTVSMTSDPTYIYGTNDNGATHREIWRSANPGEAIENVYTGVSSTASWMIDVNHDGLIVAFFTNDGGGGAYVASSDNQGNTWIILSTSLAVGTYAIPSKYYFGEWDEYYYSSAISGKHAQISIISDDFQIPISSANKDFVSKIRDGWETGIGASLLLSQDFSVKLVNNIDDAPIHVCGNNAVLNGDNHGGRHKTTGSLLFSTGFETLPSWTTTSGTVDSANTEISYEGVKSLKALPPSSFATKGVTGANSGESYWLAGMVYIDSSLSGGTYYDIAAVRNSGSTASITLRLDSAFSPGLRTSWTPATTFSTQIPVSLQKGVWHKIKIKIYTHSTKGSITLFVNDRLILHVCGINTIVSSQLWTDGRFGVSTDGSGGGVFWDSVSLSKIDPDYTSAIQVDGQGNTVSNCILDNVTLTVGVNGTGTILNDHISLSTTIDARLKIFAETTINDSVSYGPGDDLLLSSEISCNRSIFASAKPMSGVVADVGNVWESPTPLFPAQTTNDGPHRNNITRLSGTSTTISPTDTYKLADTNACRIVTGWTAGTANDFFDENGVPIPFSGQKLIDAVGPRLYCGSTWIAGYTVDQENPEQLSSWC